MSYDRFAEHLPSRSLVYFVASRSKTEHCRWLLANGLARRL